MIAKPTSPFHVHPNNPVPPPSPSSTSTPHLPPPPPPPNRQHVHHHQKQLFPLRPNSRNPPPPVPVAVRFKRRLLRQRRALHSRALTFASCVLIWLSIRTLFLHDLRPFRPHSSNRLHHGEQHVHDSLRDQSKNNKDNHHGGDTPTNLLTTNVSSKQELEEQNDLLPRRIFSTASLRAEYDDEGKPRFPGSFAWPPEYGKRHDLSVLDVGANIGDMYTLQGWTHGHSVLAFDASPSVQQKFRATMEAHGVRFAEATVVTSSSRSNGPPYKVQVAKSGYNDRERAAKGNNGGSQKEANRVVFVPYGLANKTGSVLLFDKDDCGGTANKCGRMNHIVSVSAPPPSSSSSEGNKNKDQRHQQLNQVNHTHDNPYLRTVDVFRFDDLLFDTTSTKNSGITMIDPASIWFVKISVAGHEAEVLRGMRHFLARAHVRYVSVEFSPTGRAWGIDLLEQLRDAGFACYHVRGFGKCHDTSVRTSSRACNFPFVGGAEVEENGPSGEELRALAPTFEQYVEVFVGDGEKERDKDKNGRGGQRMADLMCRREGA